MKYGPITVGAAVDRIRGSVNSWSVPMIEKMKVSTRAGAISGILIRHAIWSVARAINPGRFVELGRDRLERREQDEHVVAGVLPGADVGERRDDGGLGQELGRRQVERARDLGKRPERLAVQVAPDQRRDDAPAPRTAGT